ncbi:MAG: pyridoxamine 5'-phosphate oxidase family protein [SAR324 cluster bacterium]|jgi:hypothetical protein|nr:pyridoxamine 5'-phosphate oxidase family protein [SAR324 cluster bacterium]
MRITSEQQLRKIYKQPKGRAVTKQLDHLDQHTLSFINLSPFCIVATYGEDGLADATPRGGKPGFVQCPNDKTLLIPDWPGNNRVDSLKNILCNQGIGLVFLIPEIKETLRVNGLAEIINDSELQNRFLEQDRLPISVIRVDIDEVYLHCSKALIRSKLWDADSIQPRSELPSMGEILKDQTGDHGTIETQQEMEARISKMLY